MSVAVLLPCLDEAAALPIVLRELIAIQGLRIVVCDNGSKDASVTIAKELGVEVARQPVRGYGGALLAGIAALKANPPEVVVIMDADYSCHIADLEGLLAPIRAGKADMVLGERLSRGERGSLTPPQIAGNVVATAFIRMNTGHRYRDMGPFRAIRWSSLMALDMQDRTWGWNVEMQQKAIHRGLRVLEIPVGYRARIGQSKISGTVQGVVRAAGKILWACWKYR